MKSKSIFRILRRYVLSAAGIALLLLILNIIFFFFYMIFNYIHLMPAPENQSVLQVSASFSYGDDIWHLSEEGTGYLASHYEWAAILDADGQSVWEYNMPTKLARSYSLNDVARFSRWYLEDYPVTVWTLDDNHLLILANEADSIWRYSLQYPIETFNALAWMIPLLIIANIALAFILAIIFGLRLIKSIRPILKAASQLSEGQKIELEEKGMLKDLAAQLNRTSAILNTQALQLEKRDHARTSWIAGISHDIRTPLSIVMGYSSQIEDNPDLPELTRQQASIIRKHSEDIRSLISDLNLASKLAYNMQPLKLESVHLLHILRNTAADYLNGPLDPSAYPLTLDIQPSLFDPIINADKKLIQRALVNLINNSVRHNPGGCAISLSLTTEETCLVVSITDNGKGFSTKALEHLQNSLADASFTRSGHGLGLTLVRQITHVHNGKVEFMNLTQGCCVKLTLPAQQT